jgi:hypothetical protein
MMAVPDGAIVLDREAQTQVTQLAASVRAARTYELLIAIKVPAWTDSLLEQFFGQGHF